MEAVGLLDVVNTDPHVIRRIVLGRDRPQRVPRLDEDSRVRRAGAAVRPNGEAQALQSHSAQHQGRPSDQAGAAGTGSPPRFDPVAGGVHTFDRTANGRSAVNMRTKVCAWSPAVLGWLAGPPPRFGEEKLDRSTN